MKTGPSLPCLGPGVGGGIFEDAGWSKLGSEFGTLTIEEHSTYDGDLSQHDGSFDGNQRRYT